MIFELFLSTRTGSSSMGSDPQGLPRRRPGSDPHPAGVHTAPKLTSSHTAGSIAADRATFGSRQANRRGTAMTSISSPPRRRPPWAYVAVIRTIDTFTEWTGYLFVLLIIPLVFANVVEVFARYVLRAPTVWALDTTTMSYAALFMLGCALALLKGAHVRTDRPGAA